MKKIKPIPGYVHVCTVRSDDGWEAMCCWWDGECWRYWDGWAWQCLSGRWAGAAPDRDGAERAARAHHTITHSPVAR